MEMKPSICVKFIRIGNSNIGIISRRVQIDPQCMDFIAVHTDRQILSASDNPTKIQIEAVPGGRQAVSGGTNHFQFHQTYLDDSIGF